MAKPAIITIDDEVTVLNAIERDLRKHYAKDYRILKASSGAEALETVQKLQQRDEAVALMLVDQRMPSMTGVQFLEKARQKYPEAKSVLLTAYADTDAAIQAINQVGLDYYLLKPWDPPDRHLYPVLDDLLEDWKAHAKLPYEGIRLAGSIWSARSHSVKDFLVTNQIPYKFLDVDRDDKARALVESAAGGQLITPTVLFPDGTTLVDPELRQLADKIGLRTEAALPFYDVIIIGAGPAGLAAAVYASSEGLRCLVVERHAPGGLAARSPKIDNLLGFPGGISGGDLARRAVTQAKRFGTEILTAQEALSVELKEAYRVVRLSDESEVSCHALLLACGAAFKILKYPGAADYTGAGVYYGAAYTEALSYKDQHVFVIGGANSAAQGALFLSRFASRVSMLVRSPQLGCAVHLKEELQENEKIDLLLGTDLAEVLGKERLEGVLVTDNRTGETRNLDGSALFVFVGVNPQSEFLGDLVIRDEKGYVLTGPDLMADGERPKGWPLERDPYLLETSVPGIFAVGDVRHGTSHRVASAMGEGGAAVSMIHDYLKTL